MQLVHLHPDLEKQRSLQRKLTEWWSQLNAKASSKRLGSLQSPPHWDSYDELPKSEVTSPKIFHAVSSFTPRFRETKVIAKEAHQMMIAIKRKSIPWKDCPYKVHRTGSYDELPKSEVTSRKIFGGEGRNGMIPHLNNAAYSKAEPTRISFVSSNYWAQVSCYWPRTLFSVGNWLVTSLECPCTNPSTPCSYCGRSFSWIPTVAHSRIACHVDIAICPDDLKWP